MMRQLAGLAVVIVLTASAIALGGCMDNSAGAAGYGSGARAMPGATHAAAYDATLDAMRQRFRISLANPATGEIQAEPDAVANGGGTGQLRIVSSRSPQRRLASAHVISQGGIVRVEVSVLLQRRDTAQVMAYQQLARPGDVPNDTPIDRGLSLDPERREVWTTFNRDYSLENAILADVAKRFAPPPASQPGQ